MLTHIKRLGALTLVAMTLSALVLVSSASAQGDEGPSSGVGITEIAPQCIQRVFHEHDWSKEVHLTNYCPYGYNVKVIVAYGPDSGCMFVSQYGGWATWWWSVGWPYAASRFDRLELC